MRIVLDMQGAQSESRFRGIGRYSLSFAKSLIEEYQDKHEFILALNGLFPESVIAIQDEFSDLLPRENIRTWHAPGPVLQRGLKHETERKNAELIREAFLNSLEADVVHIFSTIEGYVDNSVTSIGSLSANHKVSATVFDLIPLLNPEKYIEQNADYANFYFEKVEYLKRADLLISISDYCKQEAFKVLRDTGDQSFNTPIVNCSLDADAVFQEKQDSSIDRQKLSQRWGITKSFLLYSGGFDERKNLARLISAFAALPFSLKSSLQLVMVGEKIPDAIEALKIHAANDQVSEEQLLFTGYVSDEELALFYRQCKLYVFPSYHEGFGLPVLEAMRCGAAVIASDSTSIPEVIGSKEALFNPHDTASITEKIVQACTDSAFYETLKASGLKHAENFSWKKTASTLIESLEDLQESKKNIDEATKANPLKSLIHQLNNNPLENELERIQLAHCLQQSFPHPRKTKYLFVDISELIHRDAGTGVQRVTRNVLNELLKQPPEGFEVIPVYAKATILGFYQATRYLDKLLNNKDKEDTAIKDMPIEYQAGDVFLGLDLQHHTTRVQEKFLIDLTVEGVEVYFVIYDLLPIFFPHFWPPYHHVDTIHNEWLTVTSKLSGVICISESVANEYKLWLEKENLTTRKSFRVEHFHLGADIDNSNPSKGLPNDAPKILESIAKTKSFLMVGTLEPRKGYGQVLNAFEKLWAEGDDAKLVIVGKKGWLIDKLAKRINSHKQLGKKLFWLQGVSDEYLEKLYEASSCLIAASYGEGFGLPLIEAAQHQLPIIARDIPVFREVAGKNAYFFENNDNADTLAEAIRQWQKLSQNNKHPASKDMPWLTWEKSTHQLISKLFTAH